MLSTKKIHKNEENPRNIPNKCTIPAMFNMQRKRNIEASQQSDDIEIIEEICPSRIRYFKREESHVEPKTKRSPKRTSLRLKKKRRLSESADSCKKAESHLASNEDVKKEDSSSEILVSEAGEKSKNGTAQKERLSLRKRKLKGKDEHSAAELQNKSLTLNAEKRSHRISKSSNKGKLSISTRCDKKERTSDQSKSSIHENNETLGEANQDIIKLTIPESELTGCSSSLHHDCDISKVGHSRKVEESPNPDETNISPLLTPSLDTNEEESVHQNGDQEKEVEPYLPYYLENFKLILDAVLSDSFYNHLFIEEELDLVNKFKKLAESEQKLFVRLFGRKHKWHRKTKIVYPKIGTDLGDILQALVAVGLILDETQITDAEEVLNTLPAPELRDLAKSFKLSPSNQQRPQIIQMLLKHGKQNTIMNMFGRSKGGTSAAVLHRAKSLLGRCYKVKPEVRIVFNRILTLFSLTTSHAGFDEDSQIAQQQFFQILMTNIGKVVYPSFTVQRTTSVFKDREELLRYEKALHYESDISTAMEQKEYTRAKDIYLTARDNFHIEAEGLKRHIQKLPIHLKRLSAGYVYARVMSYGVEALQKLRQYTDAVTQLEALLEQEDYCQAYRGRWYDRLALNLDQHLKNQKKSLDVIAMGLSDPMVRTGHRYALYQRACRICTSPSAKHLKHRLKEFQHKNVQEAPKVYVEGSVMPNAKPGTGNYFISRDVGYDGHPDDIVLCRVEQLALQHYADIGYEEGIHGEMSTMLTLLGLFLWEEIFMDVPDVFHSQYQCYPLDLDTDQFYYNRKDAIDCKLNKIRKASVEELQEMVQSTWDNQFGKRAAHVNWEIYRDVECAKGLVACIGGEILAGIFERIVLDMRNTTSGFPDLTLWSTASNKFKIVEVKGPNDRLSVKQILWLDYLLSIGVEAEVCHVSAVGAKRLQKPIREDSGKESIEIVQ